MDENIKRIIPRCKDIFTIIQDKETHVVVYYLGHEVDYDKPEEWMDKYVTNLGLCKDHDGSDAIQLILSDQMDLVYVPLI